jgi:hypothetical protein
LSLLTELSDLEDPLLAETARYSLQNEPPTTLIEELLK